MSHADRGGAGCRPRPGAAHCPPGHQAREHISYSNEQRNRRQAPGFRDREGDDRYGDGSLASDDAGSYARPYGTVRGTRAMASRALRSHGAMDRRVCSRARLRGDADGSARPPRRGCDGADGGDGRREGPPTPSSRGRRSEEVEAVFARRSRSIRSIATLLWRSGGLERERWAWCARAGEVAIGRHVSDLPTRCIGRGSDGRSSLSVSPAPGGSQKASLLGLLAQCSAWWALFSGGGHPVWGAAAAVSLATPDCPGASSRRPTFAHR